MVSVAIFRLHDRTRLPVRRESWTRGDLAAAVWAGRQALEHVGEPSREQVEDGPHTRIIRRACRDEERRLVAEPFLSIP